jgi:UDP-glucose 4-epimerase
MSAALVTGGAGFIGSHLVGRLLAQGNRVVAVDDLSLGREENLAAYRRDPNFRFVRTSVSAPGALVRLIAEEGVEAIWHLAANSDIQAGTKDRRVDLDRTFLTTFHALEASAQAGVKAFLFASTSAVFGELDGPIDEGRGPLEPISFYGAAKLASEAYVSAFARRCGFRSRIFRFPNVVGSRATHGVILDFVRRVRETGRLDVLGNGTQAKPYLHVDDLVDGMRLAAAAPGDHTTWNLAGDGLTTVRAIAEWTADAVGLPRERIAFGEGNRGWPGDVPTFRYDCARARSLGWRPRHDSDGAVRRAIAEIVAENAPVPETA